MAWQSIIESGDTVQTPHGTGTVRATGASTAQVKVNGQLFEVPLDQITKEGVKPEGAPVPEAKPIPVNRYVAQKGDRVQRRDRPQEKGTINDITQRSIKVKFDSGYEESFQKGTVREKLDRAQEAPKGEAPQPEEPTEFKLGDRVRATQGDEWVTKGMEGTVQRNDDRGTHVKWDDADGRGHGEDDAVWWMIHKSLEKIKEAQPEQQPEATTTPEQKVQDTADGLYGLLNLKQKLEEKIETSVDAELQELRELAKKNQKLEVKVGEKVNVIEGLKHKQLEQLINYAALRLSPLLVGMAGTGKTHAGEQTAVALGLDFYAMSVGAQTSKSDIIGYMAANGNYVSTHFRKAYEEGGVFLMDEIDAGNANVLIQINAALSNGLCAFPDAMVKRHEDFVFIASANTFGNGANRQYVGRNQLDAATLDRFAMIEWFIDDELESNLAFGLNGKAWYMAVRAARDYVAEKNIRALISPRATQKGSKLLDVGQDVKEVIHATMLGSVPEDKRADVEQVATSIFEKFASEVPSRISKAVNPQVSDLLKPSGLVDIENLPF